MRVLIAPDKFAGTLTAVEAARAIADGWRRRAPGDELDLCPMSDGGPGFVDVLHDALGGDLLATAVPGPLPPDVDAPGADDGLVPATILHVGDSAYVECAQACGLELTGTEHPEDVTTYGVGVLVAWAADLGAREVVVGLGGSGTTDGGAGLLAALGARADRPLDEGVAQLDGLSDVDIEPCAAMLRGARLVAATDVDNPLTGLFGTAKTFGAQKGLGEDRAPFVDRVLERYAALVDKRVSLEPGAGAAGGLGFALLALGASRRSGLDLVADAVRLAERARAADLVITGEGAFDFSSRSGKVPYGVAQVAVEAVRPCVALAGRVDVGSREMRALGVEAAYSLEEAVGRERAFADPPAALADLAERVARTWST